MLLVSLSHRDIAACCDFIIGVNQIIITSSSGCGGVVVPDLEAVG